jgi:hypothetical protein
MFLFLVISSYSAAAELNEKNANLYFDWANSLYRFAKEKLVRGDKKESGLENKREKKGKKKIHFFFF